MDTNNTNCCCGSCSNEDDRAKKLQKIVEKYKSTSGALIPVLHEAQELYGCLSFEVQKKISEALNVPLSEIYGVVTFYTQFCVEPKGKYNVQVCLGTACYVRGAGLVLDKLKELLDVEVGSTTKDGKFTLEACRCIGACGLAPVMTINGTVYSKLTPEGLADILKKYD